MSSFSARLGALYGANPMIVTVLMVVLIVVIILLYFGYIVNPSKKDGLATKPAILSQEGIERMSSSGTSAIEENPELYCQSAGTPNEDDAWAGLASATSGMTSSEFLGNPGGYARLGAAMRGIR